MKDRTDQGSTPMAAVNVPLDNPSSPLSPLDVLLQQRMQPAALPPAGQVVLGRLASVPEGASGGSAEVPGLGTIVVSHSVVPLMPEHLGQGVALSVLGGGSAVVLGLLWSPGAEAQPARAMAVKADGRKQLIEASDELELRCGEACIVLMADGRIQLRGTYITSHASATQRIVGGSVHVN